MIDTILKPKRDLKTMFVPVIFANGEDDDVPGLVAAIENQPVQFDDHVYAEDEDITIFGRTIVLSKGLWVTGENGPLPDDPDRWVVARGNTASRWLHLENCLIDTLRQMP